MTVGPAPAARSNAVATKYTADLPHPVRCTTNARRRCTTRAWIAVHWSSRRPRAGPREGAQHLFGTVAESGVGQLGRRHPSIVTPTPDNSAVGRRCAHDL